MAEVFESLSMEQAIDILDSLDTVLREWFEASAPSDETCTPVIAKFTVILVWAKLRAYMVFSEHDYRMLEKLAGQMAEHLIKNGQFEPAPQDEKSIISVSTHGGNGQPKN